MKIKRLLIFILIIILLSLFSVYYPKIQGMTGKAVEEYYPKEQAILERVIDGDTIVYRIDNISYTARLLGINTPEKNMPAYGEAKNFLKEFENKSVELQRDKDDIDLYKRKLRYLFYENQILNTRILELGLANSYYTSGLRYENSLLEAESLARKNEIGIWKKSNQTCSSCILLNNLNAINESFTISNICGFDCSLEGWFVKDAGRNTFKLSPLLHGEKQTYFSKKDIWNNNGDKFFIFDREGFLVLYYEY